MIDITKEQLERLYKKQKTIFGINFGIVIVCVGINVLLGSIHRHGVEIPGYLAITVILLIIPCLAVLYFKEKLIPKEQRSKSVIEAYKALQYDYTSDNAVHVLHQKIGQAQTFPEKAMISMFLTEVYIFRGQIEEAVYIVNSVDRSQLTKYPSVGMSVYGDIISCYLEAGDNDSVLAAYRDAEPFIKECAERSYTRCNSAVGILIDVNKAAGNYRKALDLVLMQNEFMNQFEQTAKKAAAQQTAPLNTFIRGVKFFETAELFYLNGEYQNAAKSLDAGGPMLTESPYYLGKANDLSAKIAQKI